MLQGGAFLNEIPVRYFSVALGTDSLEMLPSGILLWVPQPGNGVCLISGESKYASLHWMRDFLLGASHPIPTVPAITA